jgi:hypothetical protein
VDPARAQVLIFQLAMLHFIVNKDAPQLCSWLLTVSSLATVAVLWRKTRVRLSIYHSAAVWHAF